MEIGQILEVTGHIVEVCEVKRLQCTKLPYCNGIYFKKLNNYEIRKIKKAKKEIVKL